MHEDEKAIMLGLEYTGCGLRSKWGWSGCNHQLLI